MSASVVQVVNAQPVAIYPAGQQGSLTLANGSSTATVYLSDLPSNNGFPLGPGSSISWDAGKALYAYVTTGTTAPLTVLDNGGALFSAQAIANQLTESGLAVAIANQIVGSQLSANIGSAVLAAPTPAQTYGSGSDGAVTLAANTTLTHDMQYSTLIINAGVTLITAGFKVSCSVSLTNNGTIHNDAGAWNLPGPGGTLGGGGMGGDGATDSARPPTVADISGGSGGQGYLFPGGVVPPRAGLLYSLNASNFATKTISGGGGGGGDSSVNAGGSGGGAIAIFAVTLTNPGSIHANGSAAPNVSRGGGGGGGVVVLVSTTNSGTPATATGGSGYVSGNPGNVIMLTV